MSQKLRWKVVKVIYTIVESRKNNLDVNVVKHIKKKAKGIGR